MPDLLFALLLIIKMFPNQYGCNMQVQGKEAKDMLYEKLSLV
jgi:hypothetical protein